MSESVVYFIFKLKLREKVLNLGRMKMKWRSCSFTFDS